MPLSLEAACFDQGDFVPATSLAGMRRHASRPFENARSEYEVAMAPMLESSGHTGDDAHPEPHRGLRPSDAEVIAADRVEGAAEGALEEAFATAASDVPLPAEAQLGDPIDAVGTNVAPEDSLEKTLAEASADEIGELRPGLADQIEAVREDLQDSIEDGNASIVARTEEPSASEVANPVGGQQPELARRLEAIGANFATGPLVRLIEARSGEAAHTHTSEPTYAFSPTLKPPALDVSIALVKPAENAPPPALAAPEAGEIDAPAGNTIGVRQYVGEEVPPPPVDADLPMRIDDMPAMPVVAAPAEAAPVPVPASRTTAPQGLQPLASALDAAVQLAADANVAAEALESLKRLLEHKQQLESRLPPPAPEAMVHPASGGDDAFAHAPIAPAGPRPPPMPLHAEREISRGPSRAMLPALRPRPTPERRGLDVRGFLAGFALSWAFGVVLYLFLTAG
jgi:hypothetical protein